MADYIERDAVMQKFADHVRRSNNSDFAPVPTWNEAVQIVEDFPAADVRPVVRGKWKDAVRGCHDSPHVKCSVCGEYYWKYFEKFNYCPTCGADMGSVKHEQKISL